jgi:hypothetical protein
VKQVSIVTFTQAPTTLGSLTGVIADSSGLVLPGVAVTLLTPAGATVRTTTTNAQGSYTFSNVEQGAYIILVQIAGLVGVRSPVTITAGQTTIFNAILQRPIIGRLLESEPSVGRSSPSGLRWYRPPTAGDSP